MTIIQRFLKKIKSFFKKENLLNIAIVNNPTKKQMPTENGTSAFSHLDNTPMAKLVKGLEPSAY